MRAAGVKGATVGNHVMIGGGVTIGPGVTIGDNVFIGAGANVVGDIPPNSLALGNPARIQPLPEKFGKRNDPKQIFCGSTCGTSARPTTPGRTRNSPGATPGWPASEGISAKAF